MSTNRHCTACPFPSPNVATDSHSTFARLLKKCVAWSREQANAVGVHDAAWRLPPPGDIFSNQSRCHDELTPAKHRVQRFAGVGLKALLRTCRRQQPLPYASWDACALGGMCVWADLTSGTCVWADLNSGTCVWANLTSGTCVWANMTSGTCVWANLTLRTCIWANYVRNYD